MQLAAPKNRNLVLTGLYAVICLGMFLSSSALVLMRGAYLPDFIKFYMLGKIGCSTDRFNIYDPTIQMNWFNQISPIPSAVTLYAQNPPICIPLMAPLSLLPLVPALWIWCVGTTLFAAAGLALLLKACDCFSWRNFGILMLATLASFPSYQNFGYGQASWLITATISFFFYCMLKKRDILGGIFLALTFWKLQYVPFLAILPAVSRRWNVFFSTTGTQIALIVAAVFFIGVKNVIEYPSILMHADVHQNWAVFSDYMISYRGWFEDVLPRPAIMPLSLLLMAISMLLLLITWRKVLVAGPTACRWAIALTVVFGLCFSAHTLIYDCVLLAIPAATTMFYPQRNDLKGAPLIAESIWRIGLITFPAISWLLFITFPSKEFHYHGLIMMFDSLLAICAWIMTNQAIKEGTAEQSKN